MLDFIEPAQSNQLVSLTQAFWPLYAKIRYRGLRLVLTASLLDAFRKTKDQAAIICANHSRAEDPDVLFGVSAIVGARLHFLTAREVFGGKKTLRTKWLQKLGCFSVERGLADINAFKAIKTLLLEQAKIVMFPEGEITHQNEHLLELENGPEHMALATLDTLASQDQASTVFIIPLAMKYGHTQDMSKKLSATLSRLERKLGRSVKPGEPLRIRLGKAFDVLLSDLEMHYGLHSDKSCHLEERWRLLREGIIEKCANLLGGVKLPATMSQLRRVHILEIRLSRQESEWRKTAFSFLRRDKRKKVTLCKRQLTLVTNLISINEHSFDHQLNQEEACELLSILELALYRRVSLRKPDSVTVSAGEVIDVKEFAILYARNRQEGISALKTRLRNEIASLLLELEAKDQRFNLKAQNRDWTKGLLEG